MKGKEKCELLKSIRREIAEKNGIRLEIPECTHKGDCLGSCPRCESEIKYLEKQLELRRKCGINPIIAGISAGLITVTASSCILHPVDELQGDVPMYTDTDTTAPENTESMQSVGSLHVTETDELVEGNIEKYDTEEEYVLDGDIAFLPEDELEFAGVMPLPPDELVLSGDIRFPIESSCESVIERVPVTAAEDDDVPETTDTYSEEYFEFGVSTECAEDTVED